MKTKNWKKTTKKRYILCLILSFAVLVGILSSGIRMVQAIGEAGSESSSESELSSETTQSIGAEGSETLPESDQSAESTQSTEPTQSIESIQSTEPGKTNPDLINSLKLQIDVQHTRAGVKDFYNGERVKIVGDFLGTSITAGDEYFINVPFDQGTAVATDNDPYFMNVDKTAIDVKVGNTVVGKAVYDDAIHKIKITFSQNVNAASTATFSLGANMAINESTGEGSQNLVFRVSRGGESENISVTMPTAQKGFIYDLKLNAAKVSNDTAVDVTISFEAMGGLGAGDYFEAVFSTYSGNNSNLRLLFINETQEITIMKDGVPYGTATLVNGKRDGGTDSKILFEFNKDLAETTIKGNVTFSARIDFQLVDSSKPRPTSSKLSTYINGILYEIPLEIDGVGGIEDYKNSAIRKIGGTGKVMKDRTDAVAAGEDFYCFKWRATVNLEGLPSVNPSDGKVMKSTIFTDSVEGPGHYILLGDDVRGYQYLPYGSNLENSTGLNPDYNAGAAGSGFRIHFVKNMSDDAEYEYGSIATWLPEGGYSNTTEWITLESFLEKYPERLINKVLYGDGSDPRKVTSFTLDLRDLNGYAIELEYSSYIAEGSDASIPSYKDYFYQSVLTSDKKSTVYSNIATINSDKHVNVSEECYAYASDGSSKSRRNLNLKKSESNLALSIRRVDELCKPLANVVFTLYWEGGSQSATSGTDGMLEFNNLEPGLYRLVETTPFSGLKVAPDFYFKIPDTIDKDLTYLNLTDPMYEPYYFHQGDGHRINIDKYNGYIQYFEDGVNRIKTDYTNYIHFPTGTIELFKVDGDDWNKSLKGAEFILYRMKDNVKHYYTVSNTGEVTWETNAAIATKLITGKAGNILIFDLPPDIYWFVETKAPKGYKLDDTPLDLGVSDKYMYYGSYFLNYRSEQGEDLMDFTFRKVDAENSIVRLAGAEFTIYACGHQHNVACGGVTDPEKCKHIHSDFVTNDPDCCWTVLDSQISGPQGLVTFEGLASGTYQLVETKAPVGYQLPAGQWRITVDAEKSTVGISAKPVSGMSPPGFRNATGDSEANYLVGNIKQYVLPLTGGGSDWFMTLGGLLTCCAAVLTGILWYRGLKRGEPDDVESG